MTSTTTADSAARNARRTVARTAARTALVVLFWLGVWQVASVVVHQRILLASPASVVTRLGELVVTADFWATVAHSLVLVVAGFVVAVVIGCVTAALAAASRVVDALVTPVLAAVRAIPVVSFIVLVLVWAGSSRVSFVVCALMVLPVIHPAVLAGIRERDPAMLELASVFALPRRRRLVAVDVPAVLPFLVAACRIGVGLAWKSGVAAEVIGLPAGSIGERIYEAKLYLSTPDLFAWTAVVVALSLVVERLVAGGLLRSQALLRIGHWRLRGAVRRAAVPGATGGDEAVRGEPRARLDGVSTIEPASRIEVRGVTVRFGDVEALARTDAAFAAGRVTALVGPNGSGKTTLGRVVLGVVTPDEGEVHGADARRTAAVFQEDRLCEHLSAVENVRLVLPRRVTRAAVEAELLRVGLEAAAIDRPVRELSGGQRRRVALVRALMPGADLVVLDEPFTGLDPQGHETALEYVRAHCAGRTTLLVTHDLTDVAALDADVVPLGAAGTAPAGSDVQPAEPGREPVHDLQPPETDLRPPVRPGAGARK